MHAQAGIGTNSFDCLTYCIYHVTILLITFIVIRGRESTIHLQIGRSLYKSTQDFYCQLFFFMILPQDKTTYVRC